MKDFILYEQAFALKQLGFDEPCFGVFSFEKFNFGVFSSLSSTENTILVPTFSQAFRWFREKHLLEGLVLPSTLGIPDPLPIYFIAVISYEDGRMNELFNSTAPINMLDYSEYEEAELACLKKLIEIVKGGNK
jgi:hypothetical protein